MDNATYDVLIVGGGQAGIPLAHRLAGEGMSVAIAERKDLGGSCVSFGCSPTKAAIASAKVAHQAGRASEYGIEIPKVRVDFPAVLERARSSGRRCSPPGGSELVHAYVELMNAGAPYSVIRDAVHIHPTLAEDVQSVVA